MAQWKWVIGIGLLVALCAGVCWMDTASGIRMVAMIRECCQSTRNANYHTSTYRTLPPVNSKWQQQQQPDDRSPLRLTQLKRTIPLPARVSVAIATVEASSTRTHADHQPTEQTRAAERARVAARVEPLHVQAVRPRVAVESLTPRTSSSTTPLPNLKAVIFDPQIATALAHTPTPATAVTKPSVAASGELETKAALERLFGVQFKKVRPSWLRNPATGRNLEIDCFNAVLRIGVEYNGIGHYAYPNPFHKTAEEFAAQLQRDELKKQLAEAIGITLLVVPFTVKRKGIEAFLKAELKSRGIGTLSDTKTCGE